MNNSIAMRLCIVLIQLWTNKVDNLEILADLGNQAIFWQSDFRFLFGIMKCVEKHISEVFPTSRAQKCVQKLQNSQNLLKIWKLFPNFGSESLLPSYPEIIKFSNCLESSMSINDSVSTEYWALSLEYEKSDRLTLKSNHDDNNLGTVNLCFGVAAPNSMANTANQAAWGKKPAAAIVLPKTSFKSNLGAKFALSSRLWWRESRQDNI